MPLIKVLHAAGADVNAVSTAGFTALIVAAAAGHAEQITYLIKNGAKVDALHEESATALMYAAATGHFECVKILIAAGATVDLKHANGGTALQEVGASAAENAAEIADFLMGKGADGSVVDNDGVTPLMSAASAGNCEIVKMLAGSQKGNIKYIDATAQSGGSALMFAAGNGKVECVETLIGNGADIHMTVQATAEYLDGLAQAINSGQDLQMEEHVDGVDSLMIAAGAGHEDVVKLLLGKGSDPKKKDDDDKTALSAAVKGNFGEVASLLVVGGSDPNDDYIDEEGVAHNLLMDAIIVENEEFTKLLVENGADVGHVDENGVTTLLQACHRGLTETAALLLKNGAAAAADVTNVDGITPIVAAASEGHSEIVNLLVAANADVNTLDKDGTSALMAAAVRGHKDIVSALLATKVASVNLQNTDGHTALMFAYNGKNQVETLWERYESYMAESGEADEEENSLIIKEALENHSAVVGLLIAAGADATLKDNEGHTASDFDFNPDLDVNLIEREKAGEKKRAKSKQEL